jgi:hypothetical protein
MYIFHSGAPSERSLLFSTTGEPSIRLRESYEAVFCQPGDYDAS